MTLILPPIDVPNDYRPQAARLLESLKALLELTADPAATPLPQIRAITANIESSLDSGLAQLRAPVSLAA